MQFSDIIQISVAIVCLIACCQYCYISYKKSNIIGIFISTTLMQIFLLCILYLIAKYKYFELDVGQILYASGFSMSDQNAMLFSPIFN